MKRFTTLFICLGTSLAGIAQNVGIGTNTPNASALLELQSTNKGLLLPRVADTNAVASPAKGLIIYSNASNNLWFYNGSYWQVADGSATDAVWQAIGNSTATTERKYVKINDTNDSLPLVEGLTVDGHLAIQKKTTFTKTAPTALQTKTMDNTSIIYEFNSGDSTGRIFDPGGANNNYNNNMQGNIRITGLRDIMLTFNSIDFGILTGDTLWIGPSAFPDCRNDYTYRFTYQADAPPPLYLNTGSYIIFRSNGDNINGRGFDITFKKLYPVTTASSSFPVGAALYFDVNKRAFRAGEIFGSQIGLNSTAIGYHNIASGDGASALGLSTTASGFGATAMGSTTQAVGGYSTAMGAYTKANSFASIAMGYLNDTMPGTSKEQWVNTDPLLYIGNGYNGASNALVIYKNANVDINGYTRLGKLSEGAPEIKMKELSGTTSSINNGSVSITHGLNSAKIISVQALVEYSTGNFVPTAYTYAPELHFNYLVQTDGILVVNNASTCTGTSICNKPVKILITYKE